MIPRRGISVKPRDKKKILRKNGCTAAIDSAEPAMEIP